VSLLILFTSIACCVVGFVAGHVAGSREGYQSGWQDGVGDTRRMYREQTLKMIAKQKRDDAMGAAP
jgi:hypothetical protein